jgi:Leucine-rich repeat (LRR) protein
MQARAGIWVKTGVIGLRGEGLERVPLEVFEAGSAARVADLGGNALETLPEDFCRLPALQRLRLSHNRLSGTGFHEALSRLSCLSVLALDHNRCAA